MLKKQCKQCGLHTSYLFTCARSPRMAALSQIAPIAPKLALFCARKMKNSSLFTVYSLLY